MSHEKDELEKEREALMKAIARHKKQLHDLDEEVLDKLFHVQGDLLSDDKLPDALFNTKKTSDEVRFLFEYYSNIR